LPSRFQERIEELVRLALRVLTCLALNRQYPNPTDVARLRQAVSEEERDCDVDALAAYIIKREMQLRR